MANLFDDPKTKTLCEGCLTGNPFKCRSFAGNASQHASREKAYAKAKGRQRRQQRAPPEPRVYHRDPEG